jgi:hypothetical protein
MELNRGILQLPVILVASIIIIAMSIFIYMTSNNVPKTIKIEDYTNVKESEIDICEQSSDCVVVPYDHCCGSTKRAINKKYKTLYITKPSWQKFMDSGCHLMGICPDDSKVTEAFCEKYDNQMKCRLKF